LIAFSFDAYSSDWVHQKKMNLDSGKTYLITVESLNSDVNVQLRSDQTVLSTQNNFGLAGTIEYLVFKVGKENSQYDVYVEATQKNDYKAQVDVKVSDLHLTNEIQVFEVLYQVSQLNYSKTSEDLNRIQSLLEELLNNKLSDIQHEQVLIQYLFLLLENRNFGLMLKSLSAINSNKFIDSLSRLNLYWIQAELNSNIGQFNDSIEYLNYFLDELAEIDGLKSKLSWQINREAARGFLGFLKSVNYIKNKSSGDNGFDEINLALTNSAEIGDNLLIADMLIYLGTYHSNTGQLQEAIATLHIAEEYLHKSKTDKGMIDIYNQRGLAYRSLNLLVESQYNFRKALQLTNEDTPLDIISSLFYNLALTYKTIGDYDRSYRYFIKSNHGTQNTFYQSLTNKALGTIERLRGNVEESIIYHKNNVDDFKDESFNIWLDSIYELSLDYYKIGDHNEVIRLTHLILILSKLQVLNADVSLSKVILKAINLDNIDNFLNLYQHFNSLSNEKLNSLLKKVLKLSGQINNATEFKSIVLLTSVYLSLGDLTEVEELNISLDTYNELDLIPVDAQLDYFNFKINYFILIGDHNSIESTAKHGLETIYNFRLKFPASDLALYWTDQAKEFLNSYINYLYSRNNIEKLLEVLDQYFSINLKSKRVDSLTQDIKIKSNKLKVALNEYIANERSLLINNNDINQANTDIAKENLLGLIKPININVENVKKSKTVNIKNIHNTLANDELVVRFVVNNKSSFAIVLTNSQNNNGISYSTIDLPPENELEEIINSLLAAIKNKSFSDLSKLQNKLSKLFPINLLKSQKYKKIIIIPDGILNLLPFELIQVNLDQEFQYLNTVFEIDRTYSLSDYLTKTNIQKGNLNSVSVLANPYFLDQIKESGTAIEIDNKLWEFKSLPFTQNEANNLLEVFPDFHVNLLTGKKATNENFLSDNSRDSNIIHIATHGFFNEENLENVGLATSIVDIDNNLAPGILTMREILYHTFKANLVVVSGCETTLGKHINGEGFNGLSRGFLSQGAGSVIGTIWAISDRATSVFMKEFYTNLRDMNGNVSKALNTTKRNFATQSQFRRYRHPYYWAGFVLTSSNRGISENIFN
jgi:CHAT domain-containing protein/tetratricopeptide (TPR) repeat protein